jgi:apolipoprotein N-acyltransferase
MQGLNSWMQACTLPRASLVALLLGALNVFSFAPFFIWPLQFLSSAALFLFFLAHPEWNKKQVFLLGFSYSFGMMLGGVSWLLIAMTRYGGMAWPLAMMALALLAGYMSLFAAFTLLLARSLRQRWGLSNTHMLLAVLPALWALFEYLRAYLMTGFPWLTLAYAHVASPLAGLAPILGVYGVSGVVALLAGALGLLVSSPLRQTQLVAAALVVGVLVSSLGLKQIAWTEAYGQPISVRLAQGNIDQGKKFDSEFIDSTLSLYHGLVTQQAADLIAVPETALPILTSQLPQDLLPSLRAYAQSSGSHLFIGVAVDDGDNRYSNSVLGYSPKASPVYRYDKHHLVPFGEFVPFGFRWFVNMMKIPLGEFASPGVLQPNMQVKDQRVMPNICYEDLFGDEIALQLRAQARTPEGAASILLNVSNLAWYGDSIAIPQHLQISQMRSLETGRPMLRSTNTGATAIINPRGEVVSQLPNLKLGTLAGQVQGMQGLTPYIRFGDSLMAGLGGLALLGAYFSGRRQVRLKRQSTQT